MDTGLIDLVLNIINFTFKINVVEEKYLNKNGFWFSVYMPKSEYFSF